MFWPQDFIYLTGLLIVCALSLFLFTAVAGRLWCGYACPQTVYTEIFLWIERKIEGDRIARMRLDAQPLSLEKLVARAAQARGCGSRSRCGPASPSSATSRRSATSASRSLQLALGPWELFWVLFYGFATYGNAGWHARAGLQVHVPLCALPERDVRPRHADHHLRRGARRAARRARARPTTQATGLGDCVDCGICVQVCPTGIDIRNGLQYECIGCAACIDGCDQVMDKMGYPRGLIRYSTENALERKRAGPREMRRVLRPARAGLRRRSSARSRSPRPAALACACRSRST